MSDRKEKKRLGIDPAVAVQRATEPFALAVPHWLIGPRFADFLSSLSVCSEYNSMVRLSGLHSQ